MSFKDTPNSDRGDEYSLWPFFEQTTDLLCIAGFDGYFKKVNPALSKLLGYSDKELMEKPIDSFIHRDDLELTRQHREKIRQGIPLLNFENRYVSKEGKVIWFSWTSIPRDDDQLVYAIAKNVTHLKKHEEERNQLLTSLAKTNQRLKQINYTTSHDLRAPVSNLLAVFDLIDESTIKNPETLEFFHLLKQVSENLKKSIDNYVDQMHKDQASQINIEPVSLNDALSSVTDSLHALIQDSNTEFKIDFGAFDTINYNRGYLDSIFLNLISNSIKYAHPNRTPVIDIKTSIQNGNKQLIFSDNGLGFDSKKEKEKVFGLHQKFHDHADSKGIGLYLVYNHIADLGGTITVDSEVNKGTTFTITFAD